MDGDLSSYFDESDENERGFTNSSLKQMHINSHDNDDDKGKLKAHFPLEHIFGFCRKF